MLGVSQVFLNLQREGAFQGCFSVSKWGAHRDRYFQLVEKAPKAAQSYVSEKRAYLCVFVPGLLRTSR